MLFTEENSFVPGDPVQVLQNPNILGKVTRTTEGKYSWIGVPMLMPLVHIKLMETETELAYYPEELRICKCAIRIPKGVSQCQK